MIYNVGIVGGGFSGLCAAVMLKQLNIDKIALFDINKRIAKKVLATGNGQGNITNVDISSAHYHGDVEFANLALERFGRDSMLDFFQSLGLLTAEKEGKIYPASFCASAVADVLRFSLDGFTDIFTETRITKIQGEDGAFVLTSADGRSFKAKKVILAFGGSSGDGFNTDGKSYTLAKELGHRITDLSPSLVQLKTEREKIRGLKGIKQFVRATLIDGKKEVKSFSGDLLFTDYGVSGNAVFSLSAYLKGLRSPEIRIEFLPEKSLEKLTCILKAKVGLESVDTTEKLMISVLPTRLTQTVINVCGLSMTSKPTEAEAEKIARLMKNFVLKVEGTAGFAASQVTAGGVDCSTVNSLSMESRLKKGIYIIGEALNVDGDCGGYNLQWAYSSAAACVRDLAKKN